MATVIATNDSTAEINIVDLSYQEFAIDETKDLSALFSFDELSDSIDLKTLITAGTIRINDGTIDLTAAEGVEHLTPASKHEVPTSIIDFPEVPPIVEGMILEGNSEETGMNWVEKPLAAKHIVNIGFGGSGGSTGGGGLSSKSTSWEVMASFVFPGTDEVGIPSAFEVIAWSKDGENADVRLVDYTNSNTIARIDINSISSKQISVDDTLTNLPSGQSIFEIQGKTTNNKKELYVEAVILTL